MSIDNNKVELKDNKISCPSTCCLFYRRKKKHKKKVKDEIIQVNINELTKNEEIIKT